MSLDPKSKLQHVFKLNHWVSLVFSRLITVAVWGLGVGGLCYLVSSEDVSVQTGGGGDSTLGQRKKR